MYGIIIAVIASATAFLLHMAIISSGIIRVRQTHRIRKLIAHGKLLSVIWALVGVAFAFVYNSAIGSDALISDASSVKAVFESIYGVVFFGMLFFIYLSFYYVADRSVSSRIMISIETAPQKRLTFEELKGVYNVETKYNNELKGMVEGGFIRREGDYYINTAKGTVLARLAGGYKRIFRLGKGG